MSPDAPAPAQGPALGSLACLAIRQRYAGSQAASYEISEDAFQSYVAAVVARYGAALDQQEQLELIAVLHLEDLVLARACTAGNNRAWSDFLARFRHQMQTMARQIARDDAAGSELADGLYAELYGIPNRDGRRISKFDYYMGRGSLQGWLRTVLAQEHVNRCRAQAKSTSLEEQLQAGASFAAKDQAPAPTGNDRLTQAIAESLAELSSEDRFLLASYYLDRRTLAEIGRQMRVHESTISRKIDRVINLLRKQLRRRMQAAGMDRRQCDELFAELDVRDLDLDLARNLRQDPPAETFPEMDG